MPPTAPKPPVDRHSMRFIDHPDQLVAGGCRFDTNNAQRPPPDKPPPALVSEPVIRERLALALPLLAPLTRTSTPKYQKQARGSRWYRNSDPGLTAARHHSTPPTSLHHHNHAASDRRHHRRGGRSPQRRTAAAAGSIGGDHPSIPAQPPIATTRADAAVATAAAEWIAPVGAAGCSVGRQQPAAAACGCPGGRPHACVEGTCVICRVWVRKASSSVPTIPCCAYDCLYVIRIDARYTHDMYECTGGHFGPGQGFGPREG